MRTYNEEQRAQKENNSSTPGPSNTTSSPSTPRPVDAAIHQFSALMDSPPPTPSRWIDAGKELHSQLVRTQARAAILSERIRELQVTEKGRNKTGDRRKPSGQSRFFNIDALNEMREERDTRDREVAERRARGCGHGRGRGRGSRGGSNGRGRGAARVTAARAVTSSESEEEHEEPESEEHDELSPAKDQLPQELLEGFDGEPPVFDDDYDESGKENRPEGTGQKRGAGASPELDNLGPGTRRSKRLRCL